MEKAGDIPESQVEPRITRELAKQVVNSGGKLNWFGGELPLSLLDDLCVLVFFVLGVRGDSAHLPLSDIRSLTGVDGGGAD